MQFWDSSALIPLVVRQGPASRASQAAFVAGEARVIAFIARIECQSALERLAREAALSAASVRTASARLQALLSGFDIVAFSPEVERNAIEVLRRHALRSFDSIQLACAITVASAVRAQEMRFVSCDRVLNDAAVAEGFLLVT